MTPYKPREAGSAYEALAKMMGQIAASEGRDESAGVEIAAAFEDVSPFTLRKQLDPDQKDRISFSRVARLTSKFGATAAAEHLAILAGGVFMPVPHDDLPGRWGELSAEAAEDCGKLLADIFKALSPTSPASTEISCQELDPILRDLFDMSRVVAALMSLAMAAKKAGRP